MKSLNQSPEALKSLLQSTGQSLAYFVQYDGQFVASHPALNGLKSEIEHLPDFDNHEGIFIQFDPETDAIFTASVHKTKRGQGQGGVRFRQYDTIKALIDDGLRLSKGMAEKNAVAGIWWGGGKGIIYRDQVHNLEEDLRYKIFQNYGKFVASLNGIYIAAEDMNVRPEDIDVMYQYSRFTTCIPKAKGGSSNPSTYTAKGVFSAIKAAVEVYYGEGASLKGKKVLLQGAGNVGFHVLEQLVEHGATAKVFEISERNIAKVKDQFSAEQVSVTQDQDEFFSSEADILSPNAIGGILNEQSIANLKVNIVAGGANNQLLDPIKDSQLLYERGIMYVPDFFLNRLGIVNCANEQYGYVEEDMQAQITKVYNDTLDLLKKAKADNVSPQKVATELSTKLMEEEHPIWGHRGPKLIAQIIKNNPIVSAELAEA